MPDIEPSLNTKLGALRKKFLGGVQSRLALIERAAGDLAASTDPETSLAQVSTLSALAHTLAGTASTFSFEEIRHAARSFELECDDILTGEVPAITIRREMIDRHLTRLRQAVSDDVSNYTLVDTPVGTAVPEAEGSTFWFELPGA